MDLVALAYAIMLALGGVALDAYQNPKSMVVEVIAPGSNTTPSLDRRFISVVVQGEIDRAVKVRSLITRPNIRPSDDKSTIETIAEALGGGALVTAFADLAATPPSRLRIGLFNENDKPAILVNGMQQSIFMHDVHFDNLLYQEDNETVVQLIKRAAIDGVSQIDPYLAMLYLLQETRWKNDDRFAKEALRIADRVKGQLPKGRASLLARLTNLEGLVHLNRRDLETARTTFLRGIDLLPGQRGPIRAVLNINIAFVEIAQGNPDSAANRLAILLAPGGMLAEDNVFTTTTSDGKALVLGEEETRFLRSTGIMMAGCAALARNDMDGAERFAKQALDLSPTRLMALSLLADIAERRGNAAEAGRLRASIVDLQFTADPYMETANAFATLSLVGPTPKITPSLYIFF
jgi:tetratricopeptide (TPR) repeat protein